MPRRYRQTCPIARAAEILGERWNLLIVRELLLSPKRFGTLRNRLTGVSTSVLAQRLEVLEEHGVVQKSDQPPPASTTAYTLTPHGMGLRPVLEAIARWGLRFAFPPDPEDHFEPEWMRSALSTFASREPTPDLHVAVTMEIDGVQHTYDVCGGLEGTRVEPGPSDATDRIEVAPALLPMLMAGLADWDASLEAGVLRAQGNLTALREFPALFEMDFGPVALDSPASD